MKMLKKISIDYFIRLGGCQGKISETGGATGPGGAFAIMVGLFHSFSVGSANISVYIRG